MCWRLRSISKATRRCAPACCWRRILAAQAWPTARSVGRHRARGVLWAEQDPFALAVCAVDRRQRDAIVRASAGYVGVSDGWQDFAANGAMTWAHATVGPGNVAMMAELPKYCVLALGFGSSRQSPHSRTARERGLSQIKLRMDRLFTTERVQLRRLASKQAAGKEASLTCIKATCSTKSETIDVGLFQRTT